MPATKIIDVHAHMLSEDMMQRLRKEAPDMGFELSAKDGHGATLRIGAIVQTPYARGGWDLDKRLADMESAGIDMQVVTVVPQTFLYDLEPKRTQALCEIQNEMLGELVRRMPDKFQAIGTLPMQSPELAATVLERAIKKHGLKGMMICSHVEGKNLELLRRSASNDADRFKPLARELSDLATKLHDWAQLLKLANGFLRDRATKYKLPLARAIVEQRRMLVEDSRWRPQVLDALGVAHSVGARWQGTRPAAEDAGLERPPGSSPERSTDAGRGEGGGR